MEVLSFVLILVGTFGIFASIIYALISVFKKNGRVKKSLLTTLLSSIIFIVGFIILGSTAEPTVTKENKNNENNEKTSQVEQTKENDQTNSKPVSKKEKQKDEQLTPTEEIQKIITDKLGKKSNTDKERIISIDDLSESEDSLYYVISLNADDVLTTNMIRSGMLMDSKKILEPISKIENLKKVVLQWYFPMVDEYGNESDSQVMIINIEREALDKINWDNFDYENFRNVATTYFEHPALKK